MVGWARGVFPAAQVNAARLGLSIGPNGERVTKHFYKLVFDAPRSGPGHIGSVTSNEEGERSGLAISYQELVKRTDIEFLPRIAPQH